MDDPSKPPIHVSAIICESIITEKLPRSDGSVNTLLTAYHIADGYTVAPETVDVRLPDGRDATTKYFPNIKFGILILARGESRKFKLRLRGKKPDEELIQDLSREFDCETTGQVEGSNSSIAIHVTLPGNTPGTYWFWIYVDDEVALKLPMLVHHASPGKIAGEAPISDPQPKA